MGTSLFRADQIRGHPTEVSSFGSSADPKEKQGGIGTKATRRKQRSSMRSAAPRQPFSDKVQSSRPAALAEPQAPNGNKVPPLYTRSQPAMVKKAKIKAPGAARYWSLTAERRERNRPRPHRHAPPSSTSGRAPAQRRPRPARPHPALPLAHAARRVTAARPPIGPAGSACRGAGPRSGSGGAGGAAVSKATAQGEGPGGNRRPPSRRRSSASRAAAPLARWPAPPGGGGGGARHVTPSSPLFLPPRPAPPRAAARAARLAVAVATGEGGGGAGAPPHPRRSPGARPRGRQHPAGAARSGRGRPMAGG